MRLALALVAMTLSSCAWAGEDDRMYEMAARASLVARSVHAAARSPATPAEMDGEALVARAMRNDPKTLAALAEYFVTARRDGKASVLLVCDKDRARALVEDAGCTQPVEKHRWQQASPCGFTLEPQAACATQ